MKMQPDRSIFFLIILVLVIHHIHGENIEDVRVYFKTQIIDPNAPNELIDTTTDVRAGPAAFGIKLKGNMKIKAEIVEASPFEACGQLDNADEISGKIVLVKRGNCPFIEKARLIESLGAKGGIVLDERSENFDKDSYDFRMGFDGDDDINIPMLFLYSGDAQFLLETMEDDPGLEVALSSCGDEYNSHTGLLHYPSMRGNYFANENCTWIIRGAVGTINITFDSFDIHYSDSLTIRDGESFESQVLGKFSGAIVPKSIQTSTNAVHLHFTSDETHRYSTGAGFKLHWQLLDAPIKPFYQININQDYEVRLNFSVNPKPTSLKWYHGPNFQEMPNIIQIPSDNGKIAASLIDLDAGKYQALLKIDGITKEDIATKFKLHVTNEITEADYRVVFSELPFPPTSLQFSDNMPTSVRISWTQFKPEDISYYVIQYKSRTANWNFKEISGIVTNTYNVRDLRPSTEYEFYVWAVNEFGVGPPSKPAYVTPASCGGEYNTTSGSISHDVSYKNNKDNVECTWIIRAGFGTINIEFLRFDFSFTMDFLTIRDGESIESNVLGNFTGRRVPSSIQTTTNAVHLHFKKKSSLYLETGLEFRWEREALPIQAVHEIPLHSDYEVRVNFSANPQPTNLSWFYEPSFLGAPNLIPVPIDNGKFSTSPVIDLGGGNYQALLKIAGITIEDIKANYGFEVANEIREAYFDVTLSLFAPPLSNVQFSDVMPTSLRITWDYDGNPEDTTYVIQYKLSVTEQDRGPTVVPMVPMVKDFGFPGGCMPSHRYKPRDTRRYNGTTLPPVTTLPSHGINNSDTNQDCGEISGLKTKFYTIRGLMPSTRYEFMVLPVIDIGRGPASESTYVTTNNCGAEYNSTHSSNGTIDHYHYQNNEKCTWIIKAALGTINITFVRFQTAFFGDDYLDVRDGQNIADSKILINRYGRRRSSWARPGPVHTRTNVAHIQFTSGHDKTERGFKLNWINAVSHFRNFYQIPLHSDYEIKVNFSADPRPTALEWSYGVNFQEMPNLIQFPSDNGKFSTSLIDFKNGNYQAVLKINIITLEETKKRYKLQVENEIGKADYRIILSAFARPPSKVEINGNFTESTVWISWDYDSNPGNISSYGIQYRPFESEQNYTEISGINTKFYTIGGLLGHTKYTFNVFAVNQNGRGSPSEPAYVTTHCGGEFNSSSGIIRHMLYRGRRSTWENCVWIIRAAFDTINIKFVHFDLYSDDEALTIRDGDSIESEVLCRFSDHCDLPSLIQTTKNAAYLYFTTALEDKYIGGTGFELQWEPGVAPIKTFYQIPMYSNYEVRLNFTAIPPPTALEWSYGTFYNFQKLPNLLQIPSTDGKFTTSLIDDKNGNYQARLGIADITEEDFETNFNLRAVNDIGESNYGAKLSKDEQPTGCGGEYTSSSGMIRYPMKVCGSQVYSKNCTWIIRAHESINITFVNLTMHGSDRLYVRDGESKEAEVLEVLKPLYRGACTLRDSVQTSTNAAHLLLTSNHNKTRFEIHWEPSVKAVYQIPLYSDYELKLNFSANPQPTTVQWYYGPNFQEMPNIIQIPSDNGKFSSSLIEVENGRYQALLKVAGITEEEFKNKYKLHVENNIGENYYKAILSGCGGEYSSSTGVIQFPIHGGLYQKNEDCTWIIRAGVGKLNMTFVRFATGGGKDTLTIRDGESFGSEELASYSGRHYDPRVVQTNTTAAHLHFISNDDNYLSYGFELHWEPLVAPINTFYQITMGSDAEVIIDFPANPRPTVMKWSYGDNFQEMSNHIQIPSDDGKFSTSLIDLGNDTYQALLTVSGMTEKDYMTKFNLHVANEIGEANYRVLLNELPYPPLGVEVTHIMPTLMRIIWNYNANPETILYYVIQYKLKSADQDYVEITGIVKNFYTVRDLERWKEYEFRVVAVNKIGRGPPSQFVYASTNSCGGEFQNSTGTLKQSNYGNSPDDKNCTCIIRAGIGTLNIKFDKFNVEYGDYLYIYDESDSSESKYLGTFNKYTVPDSFQLNTIALFFQQSGRHYHYSHTKSGFELHWERTDTNIQIFHEVTLHSNYEIKLNFPANPRPTTLEWSYGPNYQEMPNIIQIPSDNEKFSTSLIDLENDNYQAILKITGITEDDLETKFKLHAANEFGEADYRVAISSLPFAPTSLQFSVRMPTLMQITWNYVNPGNVSYYVIQYKVNGTDQDYIETSGINTTFFTVRGLTPSTEYEFKVLAVSKIGRGPPSDASYVNTLSCGGELNSSSGIIDHQFRHDEDDETCIWIIRAPVGAIKMTIPKWNVPDSDNLDIRDGESIESNVIRSFLGWHNHKEAITTRTNAAYLHYQPKYPSRRGKTGFKIQWEHSDADIQTSPVRISADSEVRLNFSSNSQPTVLEWYFGSSFKEMPNIIQVPSDNGKFSTSVIDLENGKYQAILRISRTTEEDIDTNFKLHVANGIGEADYKVILKCCGGEYNSNSGMISHPFHGVNYQDNENCTWIIRAEDRINITFISFETERGDVLYIRDGPSIESKKLHKFSGDAIPWPVKTNTNTVHLQFTSDSSYTGTGFWIHWKPAAPTCSGLFTPVGDSCLLLAMSEKLTWAAAREYCQALGADLVVIKDANHYADILDYIWRASGDNTAIDFWIGGSDESMEDHWVWVTEEVMPKGPPFWGSLDGFVSEPSGGLSENCAGLDHQDRYYMHDFACTLKHTPVCQKIPLPA